MLTILIQAAAAVKNKDGDTSLHGYVENQNLTSHRVMVPDEVEVDLAVLDSIGDTLLQYHQVIAISPDIQERERSLITLLTPKSEFESEAELPAEHPISMAKRVSSISANVVPNANDRGRNSKGNQSGRPLGNIKQVTEGKSMWHMVKEDALYYAVE